jgi:regulator of protease activity HflC (stomatin/prohibitin superfamily)
LFVLLTIIRINTEWDESVILRLGKFDRVQRSGLYFLLPIIDSQTKIDKRTRSINLESQKVLTKDNVTVAIDAVAFIKVTDVKACVLNVESVFSSFTKYAQTTLRNIVGQKELDEVLSKRHEIAAEVQIDLENVVKNWGIDVERLELQDISVPEEMQRIMARQAEAEREKRGVIIASEGEFEAAKNLVAASDILSHSEYGFALRQLATLSDVSQDQSNTVVFFPTVGLDSGILAAGLSARIPKPKSEVS